MMYCPTKKPEAKSKPYQRMVKVLSIKGISKEKISGLASQIMADNIFINKKSKVNKVFEVYKFVNQLFTKRSLKFKHTDYFVYKT
jgi:hypothetical protein